ncbi:aldo/keto reductase [Lactobacillus sp. DCY120]|uniref:Aldo/keto reductase n=1 Tax=Bombilactobacillus apium TaxID=2675299 RepID=A0A850QWU7_9LACO|nr:aldo/keto reductase [Bombilactobacillus apium]NVY96284.1 aldo/keto reductase [Bombilactobacillus apium]
MTVPKVILNNQVEIPQLGLGVFKMQDPKEFKQAFQWALEIGYRHFDTAAIYGNEKWLGEAIRQAGIQREELFLTSKLWPSQFSDPQKAYQDSLKRLGLDYLDLYLIHWPAPGYQQAWLDLEKLFQTGQVRTIGVSNFLISHLENLRVIQKVNPVIDQIELHPYLQRPDLLQYLEANNIAWEAWGPLGQGNSELLQEPLLQDLAEKYQKSVPQIILRWHLQRQTIIFPKSIHHDRLIENYQLFDFQLTPQEMQQICHLDRNQPNGVKPDDPQFLQELHNRPLPY